MDHMVDFSSGDIVKVHSDQLKVFKEHALDNTEKKRYRYCLQESPQNMLHDMLLCRTRGDYTRPDKHNGIPESHTIIEGQELIVLFSDDGIITDAFVLDRDSGYLSYRINADVYHLTIPLTEIAIDYEVKLGPFRADSNIFPSWAPDGTDKEDAMKFWMETERKAKELMKTCGGSGVHVTV